MDTYIDAFVLPIPRTSIDSYRHLVEATAEIWREHGALEYREYVGEDLSSVGTGSFRDFCSAAEDDIIVFGWVLFESREARDQVNARVAADPRMTALIDAYGSGFDPRQMAYGGFQQFVALERTN